MRIFEVHLRPLAEIPTPAIALRRIIRASLIRSQRIIHPLLLDSHLHENLTIQWPPKKAQGKIRRAREHTILRLSADDRQAWRDMRFGVGK